MCYVCFFSHGRRSSLVPIRPTVDTSGFHIRLFFANQLLHSIRYLRDLISTYVLTPTILPVLLFTVRATLFPSNARPGSVSTNNNNIGQPSRPSNDVSPSIQQPQQGQPSDGTDHQTIIDDSDIKDASTPAPGDNIPSPSEIAIIKRQCATDILSLIPESVARAFFRGNAENQVNDYTTHNRNESSHNEISPFTSKDSSKGSTAGTEDLLEAIESDLLDPFSDAYCNKHLIYAAVELMLIKLIPELSEQSVTSLMEERGIVK